MDGLAQGRDRDPALSCDPRRRHHPSLPRHPPGYRSELDFDWAQDSRPSVFGPFCHVRFPDSAWINRTR